MSGRSGCRRIHAGIGLWAGLAASLLAGAVLAQPQTPEPPVKIRADSLKVMQKRSLAVFTGNVETVQGELTIRCKRLEVRYAEGKAGTTIGGEIRTMVCTGDVAIEQGPRRGHCQRAEYDRVAGRIDCTGKPWVIEGENRIAGERIVYLLRKDEVQVTKPRAVVHVPDKPPAGTVDPRVPSPGK